VLNSLAECEQPVAAQNPLVAASFEADRAFQDRDRDRALGLMFLQDGACVRAQRSEDGGRDAALRSISAAGRRQPLSLSSIPFHQAARNVVAVAAIALHRVARR